MGKNRYIRDKYKSRSAPRTIGAGGRAPVRYPSRGSRKVLFLAVGGAVLLVAVWLLVSSGGEQANAPVAAETRQAREYEAALYQEALAVPEGDHEAGMRMFQRLLELAPDNEEYRERHEYHARLYEQDVRARERALLDELAAVAPEDNATTLELYARLAELVPGNGEYASAREEYQGRVGRQNRLEEEALYRQVLEVPAEDYETNMAYYARLMEINPDKELYRHKYEFYADKVAAQHRAREERLLEQVRQVPAEDSETNMLFYKELMELDPGEPTYRERYDLYATRYAEERKALEQELFDQVRQVPAEDYETNMVLYEQLMELNPDDPTYREKYEHYLTRFYEAQGIEPPRDLEGFRQGSEN